MLTLPVKANLKSTFALSQTASTFGMPSLSITSGSDPMLTLVILVPRPVRGKCVYLREGGERGGGGG